MDKLVDVLEIHMPLTGRPGETFCVCRALTAEQAAEVVRVLMASGDKEVAEVTVRRGKAMIQEI